MSRYVAAIVTVIEGGIKAQVDPRLAVLPRTAGYELAVLIAASRQERRDGQQREGGAP